MGNVYYISGIDTDCGKTFITALLAKHLQDKGHNIITQKLAQTGCVGISEDILEHRRVMNCELFPEDIDGTTCKFVFPFPASPHFSAAKENSIIDVSIISDATKKLAETYEIVLVEGVGGLCVPLTESLLLVDYFAQQKHPVILVSSSKLGSINHTILSLEICKQRNVQLHTVIFNVLPNSDMQIAENSFEYISKYVEENFPTTIIISNSDIQTMEL